MKRRAHARSQAQPARREPAWLLDAANLAIALGLTLVGLTLLGWALEAGGWV